MIKTTASRPCRLHFYSRLTLNRGTRSSSPSSSSSSKSFQPVRLMHATPNLVAYSFSSRSRYNPNSFSAYSHEKSESYKRHKLKHPYLHGASHSALPKPHLHPTAGLEFKQRFAVHSHELGNILPVNAFHEAIFSAVFIFGPPGSSVLDWELRLGSDQTTTPVV